MSLPDSPVSCADMELLLRNIFNGGLMTRLPKNRKHAEAILALAASGLESQHTMSEVEVNTQLETWMMGFTDPQLLDHVTFRRALVDLGMLLRDAEGSAYQTNQTVISRYLDREARTLVPRDVLEKVQSERELRRRRIGGGGR